MIKQAIGQYIQEWLSGEELIFGKILDYYYPRLFSLSLKMVGNKEDAEELVMNALLKVWQHKDRMAEVAKFDDYLFGILRREAAALFRKQVLPTDALEDQPVHKLGSVDHPELSFKELQESYILALDKLTPKQREVFVAIREQDMSRSEVAQKKGMSLNTVNSHMNSALRVLRTEMQEYPEVLVAILLANVALN